MVKPALIALATATLAAGRRGGQVPAWVALEPFHAPLGKISLARGMAPTPEALNDGFIRRVADAESTAELVAKYDNFIFDCDGVLWGGSHTIDGSIETVKALKEAGKRTFFVTNNSAKSRASYCQKLAGFGVDGVNPDEIITSGSAVAAFLQTTYPDLKAVYMIGERGFEEELRMVGLRCVTEGARPAPTITEDDFKSIETDPEVGAVVVGIDYSFGFRQLCMASHYIQLGVPFIGANPDVCDRVGKLLMPGTGPILAAVERACGVPPVVVGKPSPILIQQLMEDFSLDRSRTIMVGDRLDTDIMFGNAGNISTVLVLTGVSEEKDLHGLVPGGKSTPKYFMESLGVLRESAESAASSAATQPAKVAEPSAKM